MGDKSEYHEPADFACMECGAAVHMDCARIFDTPRSKWANAVSEQYLVELCDEHYAAWKRGRDATDATVSNMQRKGEP